jgi:hypothetical protein
LVKDGHLKALLGVARSMLLESKVMRWILLSSGVLFAFRQAGFWLYQPYFERCGIELEWNGYILAASAAFGSLFVASAHRFEERWNLRWCVLTLAACTGLGFLLMSQTAIYWGPIFIVFHQFARGFGMVIFSHQLNSRLDSETRATALSVRGMSDRVFYALLLLPAGWLTDELGVLGTFSILGFGIAAIGLALALFGPNENE